MDVLSARFVQVLTPGTKYTGGKQFFDHTPSLIRTIPEKQIPSKNHSLISPPTSLQEALRVFLIGVAAGLIKRKSETEKTGNRSMLIHPSQFTINHLLFLRWVKKLKSSWFKLLDSSDPSDNYDKQTLISEFESAHSDLSETEPSMPAFNQIQLELQNAILLTGVHEINSRRSNDSSDFNDIDEFWNNGYSYILIGGQALERGFTIEGLTVTYMPRGIGTGQADTVQQRARFYGYNNERLGYCRVYLDKKSSDAYRAYIDHEDRLRESLVQHAAGGQPLSEWRRAFFLDARLKPTRDTVLDTGYSRGTKPDTPYDAMPPIYSANDLEENQQLIQGFIDSLQFIETDTHLPPAQSHKVARDILTKKVLEGLLVPLKIVDPKDSLNFFSIRLQIQCFLESQPDDTCTVYLMRPNIESERTLDVAGKIEAYQGANPATGYRGDRFLYDRNSLTVQIHRYAQVKDREGRLLANDVPLISVVLPSNIVKSMVVQYET